MYWYIYIRTQATYKIVVLSISNPLWPCSILTCMMESKPMHTESELVAGCIWSIITNRYSQHFLFLCMLLVSLYLKLNILIITSFFQVTSWQRTLDLNSAMRLVLRWTHFGRNYMTGIPFFLFGIPGPPQSVTPQKEKTTQQACHLPALTLARIPLGAHGQVFSPYQSTVRWTSAVLQTASSSQSLRSPHRKHHLGQSTSHLYCCK